MYYKINIAPLQLDANFGGQNKGKQHERIRCITHNNNNKKINVLVVFLLVAYNLNNRNRSMELKQKTCSTESA